LKYVNFIPNKKKNMLHTNKKEMEAEHRSHVKRFTYYDVYRTLHFSTLNPKI